MWLNGAIIEKVIVLLLFFAMATGWSYDNTKALITICGQEDVQQQLGGVQRNRIVYQRSIASELRKIGVERTWQQCQTKMKKILPLDTERKAMKSADNILEIDN